MLEDMRLFLISRVCCGALAVVVCVPAPAFVHLAGALLIAPRVWWYRSDQRMAMGGPGMGKSLLSHHRWLLTGRLAVLLPFLAALGYGGCGIQGACWPFSFLHKSLQTFTPGTCLF